MKKEDLAVKRRRKTSNLESESGDTKWLTSDIADKR